MQIHYLTWLRNRIGLASENIELPAEVATVSHLIAWLESKGRNYEAALKNKSVINVSVNGTLATHDHPVSNADEVSLFSAIAGG